jgi:hypothetical protein
MRGDPIRHCEEQSDEAIQGPVHAVLDCFAEPVPGLAEGQTRVLAMTAERTKPCQFETFFS